MKNNIQWEKMKKRKTKRRNRKTQTQVFMWSNALYMEFQILILCQKKDPLAIGKVKGTKRLVDDSHLLIEVLL